MAAIDPCLARIRLRRGDIGHDDVCMTTPGMQASSRASVRHLETEACFEADVADVQSDLELGQDVFVLVDSRAS